MPIFVGLDCGGSSTRVLARDDAGLVLFRGHAGPANLLSTPPRTLRQSLIKAAAGCPAPDAVCGCFAGLVNEEIREAAIRALGDIFPNAALRAEPDYAAVLAACGPDTDICVIAGTGSIVCSRSQSGLQKTGGRGPILQDVGSAAEVGREMINMYLDAPHLVSAEIRSAIEALLGSAEPAEVVSRLYKAKSPAAVLAKMVKPAAKEAKTGNETVLSVLEVEMRELATLVKRHAEMFMSRRDTISLGMAGGLWRSHSLYVQLFSREIVELMPTQNVKPFILSTPPIEGAVALAEEIPIGH